MAITNPPKVKTITEEKCGERCFPVMKTSKGVEYLVFNREDLELVETTNKTYKFRIKSNA
jgi:hypothetical protein